MGADATDFEMVAEKWLCVELINIMAVRSLGGVWCCESWTERGGGGGKRSMGRAGGESTFTELGRFKPVAASDQL
jgi:hypothetical protein